MTEISQDPVTDVKDSVTQLLALVHEQRCPWSALAFLLGSLEYEGECSPAVADVVARVAQRTVAHLTARPTTDAGWRQ